ncbi:MAG: hypothetical protein ACJLS3_00400 [Erythrobacter sp.]
MLASIFQNSKSALAFAASVIVCALMLVGPKESGGVLGKTVESYKDERANIANNAANMSAQMSTPVIADYNPEASGLEAPLNGGDSESEFDPSASRVIRIDPVTGQSIGVVPPPPTGNDDGDGANAGAIANSSVSAFAAPVAPQPVAPQPLAPQPLAPQVVPAAPARGEAVVTSRMIRIAPQQ